MHFAAFIEAGESMKDPGKFFKNNLANSLQLIEAAAHFWSETIRTLVHSGSLCFQ